MTNTLTFGQREDVLPEGGFKNRRAINRIGLILKRNLASNNSERMLALAEAFSYEENAFDYWVPENLSLFYGSPIWNQSTETQRRALNHLAYCIFYNQITASEDTTCVFNQLAAGALFYISELNTVCEELDLETAQERVHIRTFSTITQRTEEALFGRYIFARRRPLWVRGAQSHPVVRSHKRSFQGNLAHFAVASYVGSSPFVATQFFTVRGLRNIAGKNRESQFQERAKALIADGKPCPTPGLISDYHSQDEAYHTATSQIISHGIAQSIRGSKPETFMANLMIFGSHWVDSWISAASPITFRNDAQYMKPMYEMLRSKLFALEHEEALQLLEASLCQGTQGLETAKRTQAKIREDSLMYVANIDYLWKANRDLVRFKLASIDDTLKRNQRTFKKFRHQMDREYSL